MLTNLCVNAHIWENLKENTRREDNKLAKLGERLACYLVVSTIIVEWLAKLKDQVLGDTRRQIKDIAKSALDTIQFGALTMQELNQTRRSNIKHDLNPTYRALYSPKEEGEQMFGDNLNEKIQELNEVNAWVAT